MRLTASGRAGLGPPSRNRLVREPDGETSPLTQGGIVFGPVRHPVPLSWNVVLASGIGFERHGRNPRSGGHSLPMTSRSSHQPALSCNKDVPLSHVG
jgi:hypothetical protein